MVPRGTPWNIRGGIWGISGDLEERSMSDIKGRLMGILLEGVYSKEDPVSGVS